MQNNNYRFGCAISVFFICLFLLRDTELYAKGLQDKIKKGIENVSVFLKKEVDKVTGDIEAVQEYFDHYSWKGIIQDHTTSGVATLEQLKLNGHPKAVVVYPGAKIEGEVQCSLDSKQCSKLAYYRVVLGIKGLGPQESICNDLGAVVGKSVEKFTMTAPENKGIYEIRFRVVDSFSESSAFEAWADDEGQEPDATTTIGIIIVK
ncbi:MAG: hypothetical protein ACRDFB_00535 [Rhabdochlamydiaceae bacterium]